MAKAAVQEKKVFKLDKFQEDAINHIEIGDSVIVCAPTGSGKTLIAMKAIESALKNGKKCFYTAPLKALINQKYEEFSEKFGEDKVGILTGDTSKNRDAQVMVMTTEIYRNMLYGTTFGSLDPYLQDLKFLIFDEFHFINDPGRGTVWEESLIYSPKNIQIIALSATINNPQELIDWINDVHANCKLVETHERPVPLHHFYFKEDQLHPLLTPNGKLNPKLKERNDNRFGGKGNRFRNGSRNQNSKTSEIANIVAELHKKNLLPAIYFVFSRKGCDSAAKQCENLKLLNEEEKRSIEKLIQEAVSETAIIKKNPQLELLAKGIASHHAGMLPQWKALIERLFNAGLIKVVFSTETLAAGINMPARSTVISSISKRSDEGHRILKASEFLQMAGRAGRRGLDDAGYVITAKNNYESAGEVALLASSRAEDVESHFTASYEMVLNLLQTHKYSEVKKLISKSFGQSLADKSLKTYRKELKDLEDKVMDLQAPLCPGEIGDLDHYKNMQSKLDEIRHKKKLMVKRMETGVEEMDEILEIMTLEAQNYPCNGCPKQKPCSKQTEKVQRYKKQVKVLEQDIENRENIYWEEFERIVELLKEKNYLDKEMKATDSGKICASLRANNAYFVTEVLLSGILDELYPAEFAAVVSSLAIDEARPNNSVYLHPSKKLFDTFTELNQISRSIIKDQRKYKIETSVEINSYLAPLIESWAKKDSEENSWNSLMENTTLDDGDVLKAIRRTIDLLKHIEKAPGINKKLKNISLEAVRLLEKEPVLEEI
jgi:superfamily II RNA helicase